MNKDEPEETQQAFNRSAMNPQNKFSECKSGFEESSYLAEKTNSKIEEGTAVMPPISVNRIEGTPILKDSSNQRKEMKVHFRNSYSKTVFIMIMYYDKTVACSGASGVANGGCWLKKGWWKMYPDTEHYILKTSNTYYGFYAYSDDGSVIWAGDYNLDVPSDAFDIPIFMNDPKWHDVRTVGLRIIHKDHLYDNDYENLTFKE